MTRAAGAIILSLLVLAPGIALIRRQRVPSTREAQLRAALPELAQKLSFRARSFEVRRGSLIRDPFLAESHGDPQGVEYDRGLEELLATHQVLAAETLKRTDAADAVTEASERVEELQNRLDRTRVFGFDASPERITQDQALLQFWKQTLTARRRTLQAAERAVAATANTAAAAEDRLVPFGNTSAPEGLLIARNALLVLFRDGTPVERIVDVLQRHRLAAEQVGTTGLIFLAWSADEEERATAAGEAARLRGIAATLEAKERSVVSAAVNAVLGGTALPQAGSPSRNWVASAPRDPLVISELPAAWNFNDAIRHRTTRIAVGVIDIGFFGTSAIRGADLSFTNLAPKSSQYPGLVNHGNWVAGIIGAEFGNGKGVDGAAPFSTIHGCSAAPSSPGSGPFEEVLFNEIGITTKDFIACLDKLIGLPVAVVNASVGYNWRRNQGIRPHLQGSTAEERRRAKRAREDVEGHGEMVRTSLRAAARDVIVVSAAGNDSGDPAKWSSPFNWALLGSSSTGTAAAENIIVVEGLDATGCARDSVSNIDGTIQAVSVGIPTVEVLSGAEQLAVCPDGTSCAAPLVAAAVAQMLAVNPLLKPDAVKTRLGITGTSTPPRLNTYLAVKASAVRFDSDLADYDPADGNVDMDDFRIFKSDFKAFADGRTSGVFAEDLNRDGNKDAHDAMFCRSDFDADGDIDESDLDVMISAWTDRNVNRNTLPQRLRE